MMDLSAIAAIVAILAIILAGFFMFRQGKKSQHGKDLERAIEIREAQIEESRSAPRNKEELLERLRKEGL